MRLRLLTLLLLLVALAVAGCGGDEEVPANAVALVDGEEIPRSEYDNLLAQARKGYAQRKQEFPAAGSQEFQTLKNQAVQFLVQRVQFRQQAEELEIEVTEKQVEARLAQIQKQYFGGDKKKYEKQLKDQGLTEAQVKRDLRSQIISEKIFAKVTSEVKVTEAQIEKHYEEKKASQYSQPESRDVRHILVKAKAKADDLAAQLRAGGDFAALAKQHSEDTGSKATGGKLTITKGQTVPEFDKQAFALKKDEISAPVKTQFGFHIIQALSEVKPAKVTPLKDVREAIEQELKQTKKNEAMTDWIEELKDEYDGKIDYAVGFSPPPEQTTTGTTGTTTTDEE
jgi:parvulin-like peptidyl-prolyl isomerase